MAPRKSAAPLSDAVIIVVSQLVDDAQTQTREPSHSDIEFEINKAGATAGDPKAQGQVVGKAKRVRGTLSWALEHRVEAGEALVGRLLVTIRAKGGFRPDSSNYCGAEAIRSAVDVFRAEGFELGLDGELRAVLLDNLSGSTLTDALRAYVRRAKRGAEDAALVTGTGKDLLEATAAHVLESRYGTYSSQSNFPTLLGQAFVALGMATPQEKAQPNEPAQKRFERSLFEAACAVNNLRNRQGTGHGRPWLLSLTEAEARAAIEIMGIVCERMLDGLNSP